MLQSGKAKKKSKKSRTGSEAAQFDQKTIQEFKEAFGIMDQNKDGVIDKSDLRDLYAQMGSVASDSQIDAMLKEAPGPINFTVFLTLFGERLTGKYIDTVKALHFKNSFLLLTSIYNWSTTASFF